MRYLITGNTGFKGSWLTLMLKTLGHDVFGVALPPLRNSLYEAANIFELIQQQKFIDIRNDVELNKTFKEINPEIIVHLAAQPLVIESYLNPRETFEINAMGTFNVLEASKNLEDLKATLIITTDKVYKNQEKKSGYIEDDPLGGDDPYSSSKAMADILTQSWRASYSRTPLSIARAGNVIGGGDASKNRIIPDLMKNIFESQELVVRSIDSVRPWQHVFDCLSGYLMLIDHMLESGEYGEFNFASEPSAFKTVRDLILSLENLSNQKINFSEQAINFKETHLLTLNSDKAKKIIKFENKINFEDTLKSTYEWYKLFYDKNDMSKQSLVQVENHLELISLKNI